MNSGKYLLIILFLTIRSVGVAQDYKKEIEIGFTEYLNSIMNRDFEKSMEFILPDFFEIFPKDQMITLMEQTFNNPSIEFEFKNPKILEIKDSRKIEPKYYAMLSYSNQMNMKVNSDEVENEEEKESRIKLMKLSFEQTFGSENVQYNTETEFFEIQVEQQVYAISENGLTDWKFLVIEKKQKVILEKLLPKELLDKI